MFKYIKLKNFKSLVDFTIDLTTKKGSPKKFAIIYGENGIGKSNFISAFAALSETFNTKNAVDRINKFIESGMNTESKDFKILINNLKDITRIIKAHKTIGSRDNMVLEFGFRIKNKDGRYRLETDNEKIISETFEYQISKNKTLSYNINHKDKIFQLNDNLFQDTEYRVKIESMLNEYWGKHSLISLIVFEQADKRYGYIKSKLNEAFYNIITSFILISTRISGYRGADLMYFGTQHSIYAKPFEGSLPVDKEADIKNMSKLLTLFFTTLSSDIQKVYYRTENKKNFIQYQLYFQKTIYGKTIDIKFEKESTGTKCLIELLPYFMLSMEETTTAIDEIDSNIHDVLIKNVLESLVENTKGQIIITTHNTSLLESEILRKGAYIFVADKNACKELVPITDFETRFHPNINVRKRYIEGYYYGIPYCGTPDFSEMFEIMEGKKP